MTNQPSPLVPLNERPAWKALHAHFDQIGTTHLRDLFADDSARGEKFTAQAAGIFLDYSKNRITAETMKLLVELAEESGLREKIDAMFRVLLRASRLWSTAKT